MFFFFFTYISTSWYHVCPRVVNPSAGKGSPEGDANVRQYVCSSVLNPSSGKGVWGDTFCKSEGCKPECWKGESRGGRNCPSVCLFEGFTPEFWKGGLGGHLL